MEIRKKVVKSGDKFAKEFGIPHIITSAKDDINVTEVFEIVYKKSIEINELINQRIKKKKKTCIISW